MNSGEIERAGIFDLSIEKQTADSINESRCKPMIHNECEGIFPDDEHFCLESSCDLLNQFPPFDLWKLKLD